MKLNLVLKVLSMTLPPNFDLEIEIREITFHSKRVHPGDLFVAIPGLHSDGHDFIEDAVKAGACAVIGQRDIESLPVPYFKVSNSRVALAQLATERFGHPYRKHTMIGITGTNGKTTTAHMIRHILEYAEQTTSLFSTVELYRNGKTYPSTMTTYDAVQLQQWLSESKDDNVVMEVSSHGLVQHRVETINFDFALFTNLSHEHLDYHPTMDHYFNSKAHLFSMLKNKGEAIINTHCNWGRKLAKKLNQEGTQYYTFGEDKTDTLQLIDVENQMEPVFQLRENETIHTIKLSIPGLHNIWNAMGAVLLARRKAIPFPVIVEALALFPGVPGRLETYRHPNGALIIIDYAHTPDGLLHCLEAVNVHKPSRLVHIFGFRGGRDESKWEVMLQISRRYCDETILTLDDLNGVSYEQMLDRYKRFEQAGTSVIGDRTLAIAHAWTFAKPGDCIVVTGKGPETYPMSFVLPTNSDSDTIHYLQDTSSIKWSKGS